MTSSSAPLERRPRGRPLCKEFVGSEALLKQARSVFARHGFEASSLRSIAQGCGVDPGLVAHHFGSKDALWKAVVEQIVALAQPLITELQSLREDPQFTPRARLDEGLRRIIAQNFRHPDIGMFFSTAATEQGERLSLLIDRLISPYHHALRALIADAIDSGAVAPQNADVLASMLSNAISKTVSYRHLLASFSPLPQDPAGFEQAVLTTALSMIDRAAPH